MPSMSLRCRLALLCGTALVLPFAAGAQTLAPNAAPVLDRVVAGGITVRQDTSLTQVQQAQQRGIVDWRSFNVGANHTVQFQQPSASAVTLNRVTTSDPSVIAGRITANGQVALVNQSGVVFTQGAQVDAAGLVVSSANISNENFLAGRMVFDVPGRPDARIENAGTITIREAGLAALVAPQVVNRGTITARLGRVALAGAETHVVDLYGDGLLSIEVTGAVRQAPSGGEALVTNSGVITATGGTVQLTAAAADGIVQDLVRAGGRISTDTDAATGRAGRITISGTGGAVRVEGEVRAVGTASGTRGGRIEVVADRVLVDTGARIDASGAAGGGEVAIGTTLRGSAVPRLARRTGIATGAVVRADATERGDGGVVTVNAQDYTAHGGTISARGGPQGGNGGFVEISGQGGLLVLGTIDTGAPSGAPGTILIDPVDLTIIGPTDPPPAGATEATITANVLAADDPPADAYLLSSTIEALTGDVRLEASRDIFVNASLDGTNVGGALTLDAGRNLTINQRISSFQGLNLIARTGDVTIQNFGSFYDATGITIAAGNAIAIGGTGLSTDGLLDLQAGAGGISQTTFVRAATLQVRTPGNAIFDFVDAGSEPIQNQVGTLGASSVGGTLFLHTDSFDPSGAEPRLQIAGLVQVGGRLTLEPTAGVTQAQPSSIAATELLVTTVGTINLAGDNAVGTIVGLTGDDTVYFRNTSSLAIAGAVTADGGGGLGIVGIDVVGGDLTIAGPVLATSSEDFGLIAINASGNIALASSGSVTADGAGGNFIAMRAAAEFPTNASPTTNTALPGALNLAGNVTAVDGSVFLSAGQGGINQTGGGITASNLSLLSGGNALLGSAANTIAVLNSFDVAGNFVLDDGANDLFVQAGPAFESVGTAGTIGLRTSGTVVVGRGSEITAPGPDGRISFRVGALDIQPGATAAANLVEIAPFAVTPVTLPVVNPTMTGFEIAADDLARMSFETLRVGATSIDGTLLTTAQDITVVAPLAIPGTLDLRSLTTVAQDAGADLAVGTLTGASGGTTALTNPGNLVATLAGFAAGGEFHLLTQGPLLTVPGGTTVSAGGALSLQVAGGSLLVDGTVTGADTALLADQQVTVNGFSAIARTGSLLLQAPLVTLAGLASALGTIRIDASAAANLAGTARTSGALLVVSPSVTFGGLDARTADVQIVLGTGGFASGAVDAGGLLVQGGRGAVLTGTIAGIPGPSAAATGRRATPDGTLLPDPPPNPYDFTFNACPIGSFACAIPLVPLPIVDYPQGVIGVLDPVNLIPAVDQLRPPTPDLNLRPTRDSAEENELAPPDVRGGDY